MLDDDFRKFVQFFLPIFRRTHVIQKKITMFNRINMPLFDARHSILYPFWLYIYCYVKNRNNSGWSPIMNWQLFLLSFCTFSRFISFTYLAGETLTTEVLFRINQCSHGFDVCVCVSPLYVLQHVVATKQNRKKKRRLWLAILRRRRLKGISGIQKK